MKHGDKTRLAILDTGLKLWSLGREPTPSAVATAMGMTRTAIHWHFNSGFKLKEALAEHAIRQGNSRVIVQLIATNHHAVGTMGDLERQTHLNRCRPAPEPEPLQRCV